MKRSEMVAVIADVLIRNEINPYVSATILDALEEAGMSPPFRSQTMGEMLNLSEDDPEYDVQSSFQCAIWEEE